MKPIEDKIRALQRFQNSTTDILLDLVAQNEQQVVNFNAKEQLFQTGQRADGKPVRPGYKPRTILRKRIKGQPTNRVTLKDSGDFHRSFELKFEADSFEIVALDFKAQFLVKKYGKAILGLTDEHLQELIGILRPGMQKELAKAI